MEQDVTDRFLLLLEENGYHTQQQIADMLGVSRPKAGTIKRKTQPPALEDVLKFGSLHPEINLDWVLTGRGAKYLTGNAKPEKQPFLPGGTVNKFGDTVMPRGGLKQQLGENFGEDVDGAPTANLPTDSKGFIKMLLDEITGLKRDKVQLLAVIDEQRESLREQRENTQLLRQLLAEAGKTSGNQQEAPVQHYAVAEPVAPIGFGRVRSMYPNGLPDRLVGVSQRKAA